jgi:two-component system, cell cycle sensor histidine kinase PleC
MKILRRAFTGEAPMLLAVAALCLIIGVLLDRLDRARLDQQARAAAAQVGIEVVQTVNARLNNKAVALGRLVTAAEMVPDLPTATFDQIAQRMIADLDASKAVAYQARATVLSISLAPDLVVSQVYPLGRNRALLGTDYRSLPAQWPDVEAALTRPTPIISRPFLAVQGQRAIAVRQRIMSPDGQVRGIASVAIDLDVFAAQIARRVSLQTGYRIGFTVDGFAGLGDTLAAHPNPLMLDLEAGRVNWSVSILPRDGWPSLPLVTPTRLSVAVITLLLLGLVHVNHLRNRRQRKKERRLEKAIDALSSGFVIFDAQDRLIHWNDTYETMFDYGTTLRKGVGLQDLLQAGLRKGIFRVPQGTESEWIARNVENHRSAGGAVEVELADGRWIKILSRRTEDGDLVGVRFDITDLKKAQLKAESLSKAKSEMISVMSHELRTPLTTILGFARLLRSAPPVTGDQTKDAFTTDALFRMVKAGEHLLGLINEMLDYVNLATTAPPNPATGCNLRAVICDSVTRISPSAHAKAITLDVFAADITVAADPAQVGRILENLLSNAVKFTAQGGHVRIRTRTDTRAVRVTITDTGKGIPKDQQSLIFEAFSQLAPSGQRREGGIGLGLAMTKRLVQLQGGQISVDSIPGQGSSFTFSLPLPQQHAA